MAALLIGISVTVAFIWQRVKVDAWPLSGSTSVRKMKNARAEDDLAVTVGGLLVFGCLAALLLFALTSLAASDLPVELFVPVTYE